MAIKWELVQPGMKLWQKMRQRMGNTTMSREAWFQVEIIEIDHADNRAMARWNGNAARAMYRHSVEKLYRENLAEKKRKAALAK